MLRVIDVVLEDPRSWIALIRSNRKNTREGDDGGGRGRKKAPIFSQQLKLLLAKIGAGALAWLQVINQQSGLCFSFQRAEEEAPLHCSHTLNSAAISRRRGRPMYSSNSSIRAV